MKIERHFQFITNIHSALKYVVVRDLRRGIPRDFSEGIKDFLNPQSPEYKKNLAEFREAFFKLETREKGILVGRFLREMRTGVEYSAKFLLDSLGILRLKVKRDEIIFLAHAVKSLKKNLPFTANLIAEISFRKGFGLNNRLKLGDEISILKKYDESQNKDFRLKIASRLGLLESEKELRENVPNAKTAREILAPLKDLPIHINFENIDSELLKETPDSLNKEDEERG